MITRFYIEYEDKSQVPQYIKILKKIWNRKDILKVLMTFIVSYAIRKNNNN